MESDVINKFIQRSDSIAYDTIKEAILLNPTPAVKTMVTTSIGSKYLKKRKTEL